MQDPNYQLLMQYAMRALARRAHSVYEMRTKLKKRPQHSKELEEAVIWRLCELKLLDDQAFVERIIEDATEFRLQGPYKILQKLTRKGIPPEQFQSVWDEMNIPEEDVARAALKKQERKHKNLTPHEAFQKRAQFLAGRGFSPGVVYKLAKTSFNDSF